MDDETKRLQFLKMLEPAIAEANRHAIHAKLPKLDQELFLRFAVSVARVRARYLEQALTFSENDPPEEIAIKRLAELRMIYEEAVKAYDALGHAVERGYVEVTDAG